MLDFIKRRLKSDKGAIDKILVTLLLVVIGVAGVMGLSSWMNNQKNAMIRSANGSMTSILTEVDGLKKGKGG